MSTAHTVQQALNYLSDNHELFEKIHQTKKVAGFRLRGVHPLALILENQEITVFVRTGGWLAHPSLRITDRRDYLPEKTRNSNLKSCAPELYEGHAATCLRLPDLAALRALCQAYTE